MIPVIYISGNPSQKRMAWATRELEQCVEALAQLPPGSARELVIVIKTKKDGDLIACWSFARRMMELAKAHEIHTLAKVYDSKPNTTLIALAAEYREIRRGCDCCLSMGDVVVEAADEFLDPKFLREFTGKLNYCRMEIERMLDQKAGGLANTVLGFHLGESLRLGQPSKIADAAVNGYFPCFEPHPEMSLNPPRIPVILIQGEITHDSLYDLIAELGDCLEMSRGAREGSPKTITLVLDSFGGKWKCGRTFRDFLQSTAREQGIQVEAKIYQAHSAAANIALSADCREIVSFGRFGFHLGTHVKRLPVLFGKKSRKELSQGQSEFDTKVIQAIREQQQESLAWISERVPGMPAQMMEVLRAIGFLILVPQECCDCGIAQVIEA